MKVAVQVIAHNIDKTENVYFDTTTIYSKYCHPDLIDMVVADKAIGKFKTMLKRVHPELLAELVEFKAVRNDCVESQN